MVGSPKVPSSLRGWVMPKLRDSTHYSHAAPKYLLPEYHKLPKTL